MSDSRDDDYATSITDEELADIERRARVNGNIRPSRALALVAEIRRLQRHVEVLQDKPEMADACACGFDDPDDICFVHSTAAKAHNQAVQA